MTAGFLSKSNFRRAADFLAVAVAVLLPWSTSATAILMPLWLAACLPTLEFADLKRALIAPAGGLPILLVACAALGMLWAEATWAESLGGLRQFQKLVYIPLVLAYFRRSEAGMRVAAGFIVSCVALLLLSLTTALWPALQWWQSWGPGVPVKNYVTQSAEFAIAAFWLFYLAAAAWKQGAYKKSAALAALAAAFFAFMLFVVGSRTELVGLAVLTVVFGLRMLGRKGGLLGIAALIVVAPAAWMSSTYLRGRIVQTVTDVRMYRSESPITSTGYRIEFLKKSLSFVASAPFTGHGTGSIGPLFERAAAGKTGVAAVTTTNPHNQILAVAIQLGAIGVAILCAMWVAHVRIFMGPGPLSWFGLVIVVQNVVGSLFNTHLFDYTEGWIYVYFVGALAGSRLREIDSRERPTLGSPGMSQAVGSN
jgi:O-antigen ligase